MYKPILKVYFKEFDSDGNEIRRGVDTREYVKYGSAANRGEKLYGDRTRFEYKIAWRDPWVEYIEPTVCTCCGKSYDRPVTHLGAGKGGSMYLYGYIGGPVCPDCYEKLRGFVDSLMEGEN